MRYPGGKGKTYQHIINLMPCHDVYIETHLGGGAVMRHKKPATTNIGIDADASVLASWAQIPGINVDLVHGRAEDFLETYPFTGRELLYVDPPYLPETRRRAKVYKCDYDVHDHVRLLRILVSLPCMVLVSGYENALYDNTLQGWNKQTFQAKTHVDVRVETLWFNYEAPRLLHDSRYMGANFRQRQDSKRRLERLKEKVCAMDPCERAAFTTWLYEAYPQSELTP
jgi:site-specific DNA-adenine methylase